MRAAREVIFDEASMIPFVELYLAEWMGADERTCSRRSTQTANLEGLLRSGGCSGDP